MFKCGDCGAVFSEPKKINAGSLYGVGYGANDDYVDGCPECEGAFSKAYECEECGEYFLEEELFDSEDITEDEYQATGDFDQMCRKCIDKLVKENK